MEARRSSSSTRVVALLSSVKHRWMLRILRARTQASTQTQARRNSSESKSRRLPHLTLFTSGPQCSLCEVAKADLLVVQAKAPFKLSLYDIRRPPGSQPDLDFDRTAWRRLYQYDVPVLHKSDSTSFDSLSGRTGRGGGRVMKHRIDKDQLEILVKRWTEEMNQEEEAEARMMPVSCSSFDVCELGNWEADSPRAGVTSAQQSWPSSQEEDEPPLFKFSSTPDENPILIPLYDYTSSLFPETDLLPILGVTSSPPPTQPSGPPSRACFNCASPLHISSACPYPRDARAIAASRSAFQAEHHGGGSASGGGRLGGDENDRRRMLSFAERFQAGVVGPELRIALGFGTSSEGEGIVDYPFFWRMRDLGYPPGWTVELGGADPRELVLDRIGRDIDWANVELLEIYTSVAEAEVGRPEPTAPLELVPLVADAAALRLPADPAPNPPLPPGPPPPLPPGPPPPPPSLEIRLVDYPTTLFSSASLPIHRPDTPYPLHRSFSNVQPRAYNLDMSSRSPMSHPSTSSVAVAYPTSLDKPSGPSRSADLIGSPQSAILAVTATGTPSAGATVAPVDWDGDSEMEMSSGDEG